MKLRIQGTSLRLRLTRSEVEILRDGGEVSDTISFRSGAALTYRLQRRTDAEEVQADLVHGSISISVPGTMVERWVGSDDVGIYGEHGELRIAIEKDFRCLTGAAEEQDADAYPNPAGQWTARNRSDRCLFQSARSAKVILRTRSVCWVTAVAGLSTSCRY